MERIQYESDNHRTNYQELHQKIAYHEAGHAAAIHLNNKDKQLLPVHFAIKVKKPNTSCSRWFAEVVDGQLIHDLYSNVVDHSSLTKLEQLNFQQAYEADVINLLVGPLAEAKFIAERDGKSLHRNSIALTELKNYGGVSDINKAYQHLKLCSGLSQPQKIEEKISELFNQAFLFISKPVYWKTIATLADYILASEREEIACDEIISILDFVLELKSFSSGKP